MSRSTALRPKEPGHIPDFGLQPGEPNTPQGIDSKLRLHVLISYGVRGLPGIQEAGGSEIQKAVEAEGGKSARALRACVLGSPSLLVCSVKRSRVFSPRRT